MIPPQYFGIFITFGGAFTQDGIEFFALALVGFASVSFCRWPTRRCNWRPTPDARRVMALWPSPSWERHQLVDRSLAGSPVETNARVGLVLVRHRALVAAVIGWPPCATTKTRRSEGVSFIVDTAINDTIVVELNPSQTLII